MLGLLTASSATGQLIFLPLASFLIVLVLAPALVAETFDVIRQIRGEGVTVIMVEQNAFAALELCDRAYVLEQGCITKTGTGAELLCDPHVKSAYLGVGS